MGKFIVFAAMILGAGVVAARWADRSVPIAASPSAMAAAQEPAPAASNSRTVTLSRSSDGHFRTEARVDGRRLELIVDTGASQIALRASDAARLGIHPTQRDYNVRVSTANGITRAALIQLQRVEVEDIVVRDVAALVQPDEALGVNLLGMSFLSRVRWTHERGKLILEQ
ncbi:MAG: TIGR02281 family clan AA aspartic protease [Xanthobacteraceae bacterium]|jgi:aspartyl protease family protein